ncbi:3-beta hydroxysteroid dehydrogenase [Micromonospora acroterricola]|uniref:3-beta hydroxysteroid dehydrogenase n=1 Tax=Micromonospora acroterricola TaxID=2202421 RepID=A0A317CZB0_9ACTN|nr:NAD(P)H-binding protein [Micromonospora acroterricola]PWR07260.1 3-beta hydroxysteroid dehydrogenase [Micromonospora acroterricola]
MRIAVAGGTGWIGRLVVDAVQDAGHEPVVLARSQGVDLVRGTGLDDALTSESAVIDVSNAPTTRRKRSEAFFGTATRNLLAAEERAGVRHHVALSIVGSDRIDFGYYAGKRRHEQLVRSGPIPWTVLRSTQFHEFAAQLIHHRWPVAVVPEMISQPVAAHEVARCLVDLVVGGPVGLAPEIAGPERCRMPDMVRRLLRARGSHRPVVPLRLPGQTGREFIQGGLLPSGPGPRGEQTFDQWLASPATQRMARSRR